ncbi:MAG: DinB family protein [Anaerolineae bacterium]
MEKQEIKSLDKIFEYNLWANTSLIKICDGLKKDQLDIEVEGVYGRIHPTLVHLVEAEGGYAGRLSGTPLWGENLDWDNMPMSELLAKVQESGRRLIEIVSNTDPEKKHTVEHLEMPIYFFNWTVILQAIYHSIEHRTQIKILLTQLGVEHPDLAAWDYVESLPVNAHRFN